MKNTKEETKSATPPPVPTTTPNEVPTTLAINREEDAGKGFEHFDPTKDQKTPFINLIQKQSPEGEKRDTKYITGAEAGDLFNSASRKLYKVGEPDGKPLKFIPIDHIRVHTEWNKRSEGGGYIKTYFDRSEPETRDGMDGEKKVKELISNPKHCLVETVMWDVTIVDEEDGNYEAIIAMSGGNLGSSRDLSSKLKARKVSRKDGSRYTPAYFHNMCELTTNLKKYQSNGNSAFIFVANIIGDSIDMHYLEAKELHKASGERLALMAPDVAHQQALPDKEVSDNDAF